VCVDALCQQPVLRHDSHGYTALAQVADDARGGGLRLVLCGVGRCDRNRRALLRRLRRQKAQWRKLMRERPMIEQVRREPICGEAWQRNEGLDALLHRRRPQHIRRVLRP